MGIKRRVVKREVDVEEVYAQCIKCDAEVASKSDGQPFPRFGRDAVGWVFVSIRDIDDPAPGSGGFVLCVDCIRDVRTMLSESPKGD